MILYLRGLGNLSVFEIALIFTILGAFLVFFGFYVMLRRHKASSRKRRFTKKQLTMEQALNDRLKQRKHERDLSKEEKWENIVLDEKYTGEMLRKREEIGRKKIAREEIERERIGEEEARKEEMEMAGIGIEEAGIKETGNIGAAFFSEIKETQAERKNQQPSRRHKNAMGVEIFQENRRISHRREQLKRLEEGTVLK